METKFNIIISSSSRVLKHEDWQEFEASLGYNMRFSLKIN